MKRIWIYFYPKVTKSQSEGNGSPPPPKGEGSPPPPKGGGSPPPPKGEGSLPPPKGEGSPPPSTVTGDTWFTWTAEKTETDSWDDYIPSPRPDGHKPKPRPPKPGHEDKGCMGEMKGDKESFLFKLAMGKK